MRGLVLALLLAGSAGAQDYVRTHVPDKQICLFWANRSLTYTPDSAGYSLLPPASVFAAFDAAYASWSAVAATCSDFTIVKGTPVDNGQVGYTPNTVNDNLLIFREASCNAVVNANDPCFVANNCGNTYHCWDHDDGTLALTTTTFSNETGVIYDADTELNASPHVDGSPAYVFSTVDSPPCDPSNPQVTCVAIDVQNTMTHEIGHSIGLDHVLTDPNSTMAPTAPIGQTSKRVVDPGSVAGFCDIYPNGQPTPPCDPTQAIQYRITATNKGTPGFSAFGCDVTDALPLWALVAAWLVPLRRRRG